MPRDKSSRRRRHSRRDNSRVSGVTIERSESTSSSLENEVVPNPSKISGTPFRRHRTISGSSIRSSRRPNKNISDESENADVPEVAAYARRESISNKLKNESPVHSVRKVEEYLVSDYARSTEKREIASSDNELTRREKRRKSRRERKEKHRTLDSKRTEDDDAYDEEGGRSSERDLSRPASKRDRADTSRKSRRRKRTRSRKDSSIKIEKQENELPITEILRKAQENTKTRYEEPVPLAELTTDRIYVQRRNGFSAMKISANRSNGFLSRRKSNTRETTIYPIKVAILAQKVWNSTGLIHQGLLAGMALMHFLLIQTFFKLSLDVLVDYSVITEFYTNIFSYLVTMCVVSAFDKFDVAHVNLEHMREIYVEHSRSFLAVPLYIATLCLHQASLLVDDKISLLRYADNGTEYQDNSTGIIVEEELVSWQRVTLAKDGLAVFAWLFVALGPRQDMLLTHLKSMEKYTDSTNISK